MELFRSLAILAEPPTSGLMPIAEALELGPLPNATDYTDVFDHQLYPYASVYLGSEGMLGGEAADRIAGFWRALGQTPPSEVDHLAVMLALYGRLADLDESESELVKGNRWRIARKAFLWEHLLSWLPVYLKKMIDIAPPFYQRWSELLRTALFEEAQKLGMQDNISLHLRESEGLIDPRVGVTDEFLQSLQAPVRSGMILVRSDLSRAAKRLGIGIRIGERKFIIKSLLSQDATGMLDWLASEASAWAGRHRLDIKALGETATMWENKAAAAARLLGELKLAT